MKKIILFCGMILILSGCVVQNNDWITNPIRKIEKTATTTPNKNINNRSDFSEERKKYCESLGAQYGLITGCGDSCSYQRNPKEHPCPQDGGHLGCYCEGKDKCWNGSGCENL